MYAWLYVCMYVCIYVCMLEWLHVCMCSWVCVCARILHSYIYIGESESNPGRDARLSENTACGRRTRKATPGERLGGREGGGLDGSFFENRKQCPDFGKKGRDFIHLWVRFSDQGIVLRVSRILSLTYVFLTKYLSKCPDSTKPPLLWKISDCAPAKELE